MNLCDATVTAVNVDPYFEYGKWWLAVEYECYGHFGNTNLMFSSIGEAKNVKIGDSILV